MTSKSTKVIIPPITNLEVPRKSVFCFSLVYFKNIKPATRNAVSPLKIEATTTPKTASRDPAVPSNPIETLLTIPVVRFTMV